MKNLTRGIGLLGLFGFSLLSCDNDPLEEGNLSKIEVQFETAAQELDEHTAEGVVVLKFSKPASQDAILILKPGNYEGVITTVPAIENGLISVQVVKGALTAQVKLIPVDNSNKDGHKQLNLSLHNLPHSFISGINKSLNITIKDDETPTPGVASVANFINQEVVLEETNSTGIEYQIHLSNAVAVDSEIRISLSSANATYGADYVTEPAAEDNLVTLPVGAGLKVIAFKVKAINNSGITGELKIKFAIAETTGSIAKGNALEQTLTIRDEELALKPKGYAITTGNWTFKKSYEYDSEGRISRVHWENYTPYLTQGTETYNYDANGRIAKINKYPGRDVLYSWENGRIIKSEVVQNGITKEYHEYAYDDAGNIGGVVSFHLQENGLFAKGMFTVYLYYVDGNIYKSLTYQDSNNPEEPTLVSTRTYENYLAKANPFPMTEIVPGLNPQPNLAGSYRVEEGGTDLSYQLVYEYRPDGLPGKRIATAANDTQTAVYHYY